MSTLKLLAPLDGWCAPLADVPDPVFAERMLGDGMAIDPISGIVLAPCDGEIATLPAGSHAVTIRTPQRIEVLVHVGIDTVTLNGRGFEPLVRVGQRVQVGQALLRFDLDLVARAAKSLMTPVVAMLPEAAKHLRRHETGPIHAGDVLFEIGFATPAATGQAATAVSASAASAEATRAITIPLRHGLHARPAALLSKRARSVTSRVTLAAHGRTADARSVTAIMALGARHGDVVTFTAEGASAAAALEQVIAGIDEALALEGAAGPEPREVISIRQPACAEIAPDTARAQMAPKHAPQRAVANSVQDDTLARGVRQLQGVVAVPGFAIGRTFRLERAQIVAVEEGKGVAHESAELERARATVRARLSRLAGAGGAARREIVEAHLTFLDDPVLNETAQEHIVAGKSAGFAWRAAIRQSIEALAALDDARLRERVDDLLDIESHVLLALAGEARPMNLPLPEDAVLVADELLPSELVALDRERLRAICLSAGGPTSHVAILAAAIDVPMLVGMGPPLRDLAAGERVIVDAERGTLTVSPSAAEFTKAEERVVALRLRRAAEREAAQRECRTRDGTRIEIFANLGSVAEAEAAVVAGAEGCGLLRTEFLFIDRDSAPDETEQLGVYQAIAAALRGRPLVLRLMDVGGDKPLSYLPLPPEENPALGLRGIRTALRHPELLRTQLRAALRVTPAGTVRILVPMVTDVAEVRDAREIVDELRAELGQTTSVEIGAMIETPAAALTAERIADAVDFLSIGSNDLTQYSLAMDRSHPELARRTDALHPAVLKLIAETAAAGARRGKLVAVCGGIAADPAAVPLLIGLGVRELSVVPASIPVLKRQVRELDVDECATLAARCLEFESAAQVRALSASLRNGRGGAS